MAVMSEIAKFPLIAIAIASFGGGPSAVLPTFRAAFTSKPFSNAWIALCYTFNNLLYFDALSALSAVAYQVLSQSKTLFTAGLMYFLVGKRLLVRQIVAIGMLIAGALLVQLQVSRAHAMLQESARARTRQPRHRRGHFGGGLVAWWLGGERPLTVLDITLDGVRVRHGERRSLRAPLQPLRR